MINRIMKDSGNKAYVKDLKRLDHSLESNLVTVKNDVNYAGDNDAEHTLDVYYLDNDKMKPVLVDVHAHPLFLTAFAVTYQCGFRVCLPKFSEK